MKFGQVDHPEKVDFRLPPDAEETHSVLKKAKKRKEFEVSVGCAKWNKQDLKGFYPRGVKEELVYYSSKFNSIELNATFYNAPTREQVVKWKEKTPEDFRFFPKVPQSVSHYSRLLHTTQKVQEFCDAVAFFEEKLGMIFLQLHDNFKPKDFERLQEFLESFPKGFPLAVEVRNEEWFADKKAKDSFFELLRKEGKTPVIVDTAGRRDMMHMRLTSDTAFIRFVGANHPSDYKRLDDWAERITNWRNLGLQKLYFFIHQNVELESPLLAAHFIERLNKELKLEIRSPQKNTLF